MRTVLSANSSLLSSVSVIQPSPTTVDSSLLTVPSIKVYAVKAQAESQPGLEVGLGVGLAIDSQDTPAVNKGLATPPWCTCGQCETPAAPASQQQPSTSPPRSYCCMSVVQDVQRWERGTGSVCQTLEYRRIVQDGPSDSEYKLFQKVFTKSAAPATFDACSHKQKRLIIYSILFDLLKEAGGWKQLSEVKNMRQKPMPECLKCAMRRRWPD